MSRGATDAVACFTDAEAPMVPRTPYVVLAALAAAVLPGCRSFHGRYVGTPTPGADVGGMPIVVRQDKYLKVTTRSVDYVVARSVEDGPTVRWAYEPLPPRTEVTTEVVQVGQLFAIDVERPFAGKAKNGLQFWKGEQFPSRVSLDVDDRTLGEVAAALERIAPLVKEPAPPAPATVPNDGADVGLVMVKLRESVVKIEYFDVNDPTCKIAEFCGSECAPRPGVATPSVRLPAGPDAAPPR